MINVFKEKEYLNEIIERFYEKNINTDIDEIDNYFENINNNISNDFFAIINETSKKNRKISKQLIKYYIQNFLYKYFGIKDKTFYKMMDNNLKVKYLEKEQSTYYNDFLSDFEDIKIILSYTLKRYYEILVYLNKKEDLREIYSIYQAIGTYIISLLPESYRNEFKNNMVFEELLSISTNIENPNSSYIKEIDYILRDYMREKYDVDLFEYAYDYKRKKKMEHKKC